MFLYSAILITEVEHLITVRDFEDPVIKISSISVWIEHINQAERERQGRATLSPHICALCVTVLKLTSLTTLEKSLKVLLWSRLGCRFLARRGGMDLGACSAFSPSFLLADVSMSLASLELMLGCFQAAGYS